MSPGSSLYMLLFCNTIRHKSFSVILQTIKEQIVYISDIDSEPC